MSSAPNSPNFIQHPGTLAATATPHVSLAKRASCYINHVTTRAHALEYGVQSQHGKAPACSTLANSVSESVKHSSHQHSQYYHMIDTSISSLVYLQCLHRVMSTSLSHSKPKPQSSPSLRKSLSRSPSHQHPYLSSASFQAEPSNQSPKPEPSNQPYPFIHLLTSSLKRYTSPTSLIPPSSISSPKHISTSISTSMSPHL